MRTSVVRVFVTFFFFLCPDIFHGQDVIQFVVVSDSHYGLARDFRGREDVPAQEVNRAMLGSILRLQQDTLPVQGHVGKIDFIVHTGDITNRMQKGVQHVRQSWQQFEQDWIPFADSLGIGLYLLPGNHDLSNAIGYPQGLDHQTDTTAVNAIYRHNVDPTMEKTDPYRDKVNYYFERDSIVFVFAGLWPESATRKWMDTELDPYRTLPWIIFAHDPPETTTRHLTDPRGGFNPKKGYRFENLISDTSSVKNTYKTAKKENRELSRFISSNPQIAAYFHGHNHANEFYTWTGFRNNVSLPSFMTDSPMKGVYSSDDESMLSFILVRIETREKTMTVYQYFWNRDSGRWGDFQQIKLAQ